MSRMTKYSWLVAGSAFLLALPAATEAQGVSSGGSSGASFGRISGGGGSYGHLTHGFTARRPSARIPINALTRANGTANQPRQGRTARIPINARTMANGTANAWREPPGDPTPGPRRGRFVRDGRPFLQHVLPTRIVAVPYIVEDDATEEEPRRRLGRVAGDAPASPADPGFREPDGAARSTAAAAGGTPGTDSGEEVTVAPRVKPPVPADDGPEDASLPREECADVRITTAGGIQWRQRIRIGDYEASTPEEAAAQLQEVLKRGDPLSIRGPDGSFTVRASLVQSLIVGPCRDF